jgi:small GTP-binding protein
MQSSKKIVVLGHFGVGKTSLVRRFVENSFSDNYKVTIGVHITKKVVQLPKDHSISLIIWDLEGTDDIKMIRDAYLMGTHGAFFVFDVTRPSTFQHLANDMELIRKKLPKTPLLVIGNKSDLVNRKDLEALLKNNDIPYNFLTSAKTGNTVEEAFEQLATLLNNDA